MSLKPLLLVCCVLMFIGVLTVSAQEATAEATPAEATAEATPNAVFTEAGTYTVRQPVGDYRRQYVIHVPEKYFETEAPAPLVMVLHGAGGTGQGIESFSGFDALSDKEGFIVAYPDALNYSWNDGRGDEMSVIDDLGYLQHIIDSVDQKANIDRTRVYAAGYSRGGMMAYRLACVFPTEFTAITSVASTFPIYLLPECRNAPPKPIMVIQGTDDPVIPWMGIDSAFLSAADTFKYWSTHNECIGVGPIKEVVDANPLDGTRLLIQEGLKCTQPIFLYGVFHGGHTWPGHPIPTTFDLGLTSSDFNASTAIWDFFKAQVLEN